LLDYLFIGYAQRLGNLFSFVSIGFENQIAAILRWHSSPFLPNNEDIDNFVPFPLVAFERYLEDNRSILRGLTFNFVF